MLKQNSSMSDNMSNAAVSRRESCVSGDKPNSICSSHQQFALADVLDFGAEADAFSPCRRRYARLSVRNRALEFRLTIVRDFKITVDPPYPALFYFSTSSPAAFSISPSFCTVPFSRARGCRVDCSPYCEN